MDPAGCLAICLDRDSLSPAATPEQNSADLKFSGAHSEADQKFEDN
jgi:hypothetical protein